MIVTGGYTCSMNYVISTLLFNIDSFIRGQHLAGPTVGLAYVGTMCRRSTAIGITQDGGRSLDSAGAIAAHELGHILNMRHDDFSKHGCTYLWWSLESTL